MESVILRIRVPGVSSSDIGEGRARGWSWSPGGGQGVDLGSPGSRTALRNGVWGQETQVVGCVGAVIVDMEASAEGRSPGSEGEPLSPTQLSLCV